MECLSRRRRRLYNDRLRRRADALIGRRPADEGVGPTKALALRGGYIHDMLNRTAKQVGLFSRMSQLFALPFHPPSSRRYDDAGRTATYGP